MIDLNDACRAMLESEGQLRAKQIAEAYVPENMHEFLQGGEHEFGEKSGSIC